MKGKLARKLRIKAQSEFKEDKVAMMHKYGHWSHYYKLLKKKHLTK